jgi:uncharacterized protein YqgC (DUF456 family)
MGETGRSPGAMTPQVVVAAYLLALVCALAPPAVVGSTFAAVVLWRRGLQHHAAAVFALGVACTALAMMVLW